MPTWSGKGTDRCPWSRSATRIPPRGSPDRPGSPTTEDPGPRAVAPGSSCVGGDPQDHASPRTPGGIDDRRELVFAQLLGRLHDDDERLHARTGAVDDPPELGGLAG